MQTDRVGHLRPYETLLAVAGVFAIGWVGPCLIAAIPAAAVTFEPSAYVANNLGSSVSTIETATNTTGASIPMATRPTGIAVTPDGATAYVANFDSNAVIPINTATNTAGNSIAVGVNPQIIAITPDGATAYVANSGSDTVTPIDTATNIPGTPITVGIDRWSGKSQHRRN